MQVIPLKDNFFSRQFVISSQEERGKEKKKEKTEEPFLLEFSKSLNGYGVVHMKHW